MNKKRANSLGVRFLFMFALALSGYSGEKPKLVMKGGLLPYEDLWKDSDVKKYLDLPYIVEEREAGISLNDIGNKIKGAQGVIGACRIVTDKHHLLETGNKELRSIALELRGKGESIFRVRVYDRKSWNEACDSVYRYVTDTVAQWNTIPRYYAVERNANTYSVTRTGVDPKKWHFELKELLVIRVEPEFSEQDNNGSEGRKREQVDQVIQGIMTFLGCKENDVVVPAGEDKKGTVVEEPR